ncbi:MAG TPA: hypothetical protein V6D25_29755 [Leptolyngbyaceae cyanobacterium]
MNADPINFNKAEELLSQLTGQKLSQTDLTPPAVFLANLVVMFFSVMKVNSSVEDRKIEHLRKTLAEFNDLENTGEKLPHLIVDKLLNNHVAADEFTKSGRVATLTNLHSKPEKLLLIGLCYKILAANAIVDGRENQRLRKLADWMMINSRHIDVLEVGFGFPKTIDPAALVEVQSLLKEDQFEDLGNSFVTVASDLLVVLSTKFNSPENSALPKQTPVLEIISPNAEKPSDRFKWEPKPKTVSKPSISVSFEDATGRANFD